MTRVMTAFLPQPEARPLPDTPPRGIESRERRPHERAALGF
jgi:hypothetical protein